MKRKNGYSMRSELPTKSDDTPTQIRRRRIVDAQGKPTNMTFSDSEEQIKAKKRKKSLIIALIVIASVLVCGGIGAGIYFLVDYTASNTLTVPQNIRMEDFDETGDLYVRVRWDRIEAAKTYTVEYVYELYPDKINTVIVNKSGADIERKRGDLTVRVTANSEKGESLSCEWTVLRIPGFVLQQPKVSLVQLNNGSVSCDWSMCTYSGLLGTKKIPHYEYQETLYYEPIEEDDEYEEAENGSSIHTTSLNLFTISAKNITKLRNDGIGKISVKVRPLNYSFALDGETKIYPEDLYDLYEMPEWTEVECILQ